MRAPWRRCLSCMGLGAMRGDDAVGGLGVCVAQVRLTWQAARTRGQKSRLLEVVQRRRRPQPRQRRPPVSCHHHVSKACLESRRRCRRVTLHPPSVAPAGAGLTLQGRGSATCCSHADAALLPCAHRGGRDSGMWRIAANTPFRRRRSGALEDLGFSLTEEERRCVVARRKRIRDREVRQTVFNSLCADQKTRLGRLLQTCVNSRPTSSLVVHTACSRGCRQMAGVNISKMCHRVPVGALHLPALN